MAERGLSSHRKKRRKRRIRTVLSFLFLFLLSYLLITSFLVEAVRVTDRSMAPNILPGDVLLASPLLQELEIGDVVLVENPSREAQTLGGNLTRRLLHFLTLGIVQPGGSSTLLVRRVVALPEERISMDEFRFSVRSADGSWVSESGRSEVDYELLLPEDPREGIPWPGMSLPGSPSQPGETVPPDRYFLAADHRGGPLDSRIWGPVEAERIQGRLFFRLVPLNRAGALHRSNERRQTD